MANCERDHERVRVEQRFDDLNRKIGEITTLILTLTEKLSSGNREEDGFKVQRLSQSDMMTGVPGHSIPTSDLHPPRRTLMTG